MGCLTACGHCYACMAAKAAVQQQIALYLISQVPGPHAQNCTCLGCEYVRNMGVTLPGLSGIGAPPPRLPRPQREAAPQMVGDLNLSFEFGMLLGKLQGKVDAIMSLLDPEWPNMAPPPTFTVLSAIIDRLIWIVDHQRSDPAAEKLMELLKELAKP